MTKSKMNNLSDEDRLNLLSVMIEQIRQHETFIKESGKAIAELKTKMENLLK